MVKLLEEPTSIQKDLSGEAECGHLGLDPMGTEQSDAGLDWSNGLGGRNEYQGMGILHRIQMV